MSTLSLIFPLILLGIALWIIAAFIKILFGIFKFDLKGFTFQRELRSKKKILIEADALVEAKKYPPATALLKKAFIFERSSLSDQALRQINDHNISVLARIAALSTTLGGMVRNLPLLEELFISRGELLTSYRNELALLKRHKKTWANQGLKTKLLEIEERLDTNRKSITAQLDEALACIVSPKHTEEVTYH